MNSDTKFLLFDFANAILTILLGTFGYQFFLEGNYAAFFLCMLLFWTGIPTLIGIVWGTIDLIYVFCDAVQLIKKQINKKK